MVYSKISNLLAFLILVSASAFAPVVHHTKSFHAQILPLNRHMILPTIRQPQLSKANSIVNPSKSALHWGVLVDVPGDWFFTTTFVGMGILLSLTKQITRARMEERAWEQRLEEGRRRRLEQDPSLTELDLRRREAAMEWSAYGKPRRMEEERQRQLRQQREEAERRREEQEQEEFGSSRRSSRKRVKVMERELGDDDDDDEEVIRRQYTMTDEQIDVFEREFGIDYDPYYDDPYTEDELPEGKFHLDKQYGDRVYDDGEIFYKDAETGLFYRQGAKPRSINFWAP